MPRIAQVVEQYQWQCCKNAEQTKDGPPVSTRIRYGATLDIPEPIGQSSEVFAEIGEQIAHLLPPIFEVCQPVS
jgi:hypothetical protein